MLPAKTDIDEDGTYDDGTEDASGVHVGQKPVKAKSSDVDDLAISVLDQFLKRLRHHAHQLNHFFTHMLEAKNIMQLIIGDADAIFDDFGLRKIIVTATNHGTLIGLDSKSGQFLWRLYLGEKGHVSHLFIQRTPLHFGFSARCVAIFKPISSDRAELVTFDPIEGHIIERKGLASTFSQAILLHHTTEEHLR